MRKILYICMFCFTLNSTFTQSNIEQHILFKTDVVEPRADILEWVYKTINGKHYKRLWNATQNRWVTDWIPV